MLCARCDKPVTVGEAEVYPIDGATGAGGLVLLHPRCPDQQRRRPARPATYRLREE
ncbi:hypothetical protein EES44_24170 [Streptomyces sp. ADI96-15]|uniref:hypothetical protein n=1 Tax=Streptomyces TaxID=1883 RepID=UPI000FBA7197|nr:MULTISPECIES: hypothetical protein [Streptomyces]MDH6189101.1 hypothetical protein [Streptomyces sp. CZ24]RPK58344.1 hypothetical protein EES44_24170 [Streptomyces sp. ADI96-15]